MGVEGRSGGKIFGRGGPRANSHLPLTTCMLGIAALIAGFVIVPTTHAAAADGAAGAGGRAGVQAGVASGLWEPEGLRQGVWPAAIGPAAGDPGVDAAASSTWSVQNAANQTAQNGGLISDSCATATSCMAVGGYENGAGAVVTLAEARTGGNWTIHATPNPAGAALSRLDGVSCSAATACIAVGDYINSAGDVLTLAEVWNGTAWSIQTTPNPAGALGSGLSAISCASATSCVAVGDYNNGAGVSEVLAEAWDGTSWTIQTTPDPAGATDSGLFGVSCASARACSAVGSYEGTDGTELTLAEAWNGTSWSLQTSPNPAGATATNLAGVSCSSPSFCVAVGYYVTSAGMGLPLVEGWGGARWAIQTFPVPSSASGGQLYGVSCVSAKSCSAAGGYSDSAGTGLTLAGAWNGTSWSDQTTPVVAGATNSLLAAVSCASATGCLAVGNDTDSAGSNLPMTLAQVWNGTSWSTQTTRDQAGAVTSNLRAISCSAATVCTAVGYYTEGQGATLTLADARHGSSWSVVASPNPVGSVDAEFSGVSCSAAAACTAVGDYFSASGTGQMLAERWNGTSWSIEAVPNPAGAASSTFAGVSCTTATSCIAVGSFSNSAGQTLPLAESWNGTSWSVQDAPNSAVAVNGQFSAVSCTAANACVAVGTFAVSSGLPRTLAESWNGSRWVVQGIPTPAGQALAISGVSCSSAIACVAVGNYVDSSGTPLTLVYTWNGVAWGNQASASPSGVSEVGLSGVSCSSPSACTAVGSYEVNDFVPTVAFAEAWDGTSWGLQTIPVPAGGNSSVLRGVSCPAACTAVGYYFGTAAIQVGLGVSRG